MIRTPITLSADTTNIGKQTVPRLYTLKGKIYDIFKWQSSLTNVIQGAQIKIKNKTATTDNSGMFSIITPEGYQNVTLSNPGHHWTRKTGTIINPDTTKNKHNFNMIDSTRYTAHKMDFYNKMFRYNPDSTITEGTWRFPISPNPDSLELTRPRMHFDTTNTTIDVVLGFKATADTAIFPAFITPVYPQGAFKDYEFEFGGFKYGWDSLGNPMPDSDRRMIFMWKSNDGPYSGDYRNFSTHATNFSVACFNTTTLPDYVKHVYLHEGLTGPTYGGRFMSDIETVLSIRYPVISFLTEWDKESALIMYSRTTNHRFEFDKENTSASCYDIDDIDLEPYNPNR